MYPTGIAHTTTAAPAAAIHHEMNTLSQHNDASRPVSHLGTYSSLAHLPANVPPAVTSGSPSIPIHSQPPQHLLPSQNVIPGQYSTTSNFHDGGGADVMWKQKYNPSSWASSQYEAVKMDRERAISHDQDRSHNRMEHQNDNLEKEKRLQKWHEQERLEYEERERSQRDAVQHHFEESFRLALLKQRPVHNLKESLGNSKASLTSNPFGSSATQVKNETNFSLYGYQPFQHTYITQAQLKAREEVKTSNLQLMKVPNINEPKMRFYVKVDQENFSDRPISPSSKHSNSLVDQVIPGKHDLNTLPTQDRNAFIFPPLGYGAFKPYECSSNGNPIPAHQNNSSASSTGRIVSSHLQSQHEDWPENLVKGKSQEQHPSTDHEAYESRYEKSSYDIVSKTASPISKTGYSYKLVQQGLVPNPMYIATTLSGNSTTVSTSIASYSPQVPKTQHDSLSPTVSQQHTHLSPRSDVSNGSIVTYSTSVMSFPGHARYSCSPMASVSQSATSSFSKASVCQEIQLSKNSKFNIQVSGKMSPPPPTHSSVNHLNTSTSSSLHSLNYSHSHSPLPVATETSSIIHPTSHQENRSSAAYQATAVPLVKRKILDDTHNIKRSRLIDDNLLPPQLQPQVKNSHGVNDTDDQSVIPPVLFSNASTLPEAQVGEDKYFAKSSTSLLNDCKKEIDGAPQSSTKLQNESRKLPEFTTAVNQASIVNVMIASNSANSDSNTSEFSCISVSRVLDKHSTGVSSILDNMVNRSTVSPVLANSLSYVGTSSNINHTKLKKAWLQRHSENEDKKSFCEVEDESATENSILFESDVKPESTFLKSAADVQLEKCSLDTDNVKSCQETFEDELSNMHETKSVTENDNLGADSASSISDTESFSKKEAPKAEDGVYHKYQVDSLNVDGISKESKMDESCEDVVDEQQSKKESKKPQSLHHRETHTSLKKRGRKTKSKGSSAIEVSTKKQTLTKDIPILKPLVVPSITQLRKTGEHFLQDGPCYEVAPRLPKCRECRMTANQRNKKMPDIFCRFYAYRKLRYGKNGTILSAGFSEPGDATEDDLKLWLPPVDSPPKNIEIETSKFLLMYLGDHFCDLVEMEREAQKMHMSQDGIITWKRVVQGVREMCDVCETTLFNIHWVCHKCGFVVCIDCYKSRKNGLVTDESIAKDCDEYHWLLCSNRQPHEQEKLMLTQIIAGTALWNMSRSLHEVRQKWNISAYCSCAIKNNDHETKHSTNGICKLMSAVTKCFSSDKDSSQETNSAGPSHSKKSSKGSANGMVKKQESGSSGCHSESGESPLSWLADASLTSKMESDADKDSCDEEKSNQDSNGSDSSENDEDKNENFSTLRELLIRPTGKMGGKGCGSSGSSQKTLTSTLDEVISCVIEQKVRKSDKKCKEKQLLHFTRRYQTPHSGRELPPIRSCMLAESSLLYPEIPHMWLGGGKLLLLKDPCNSGNMQMFQEQWKRGQPVIIADVGKRLDPLLWKPESFVKEFGDVKSDFLNCQQGTILQNQPLRKFWEGFENVNKRMKADDGEYLVLKLKDWPPCEEFTDILPSRYGDFMKVLPLPQYTNRDGIFNMASRLPDCFIGPELGPKMSNAYGFNSSNGKGSINLHLDISDAINVLAYVGATNDEDEGNCAAALKALDENGLDSAMKKRAKEKCSKPGAIWHVFNARDADKIRDFLNKISEEQGVKQNPHHDPIHNQEWYLDENLRSRLFKEYGVEAYAIAQCYGDAIFIPAGAPHQVKNLYSCVNISEDFISPESIGHIFFLTEELRNLHDTHITHEDKLQVKNIIYHAVRDSLALLHSHDPGDPKT